MRPPHSVDARGVASEHSAVPAQAWAQDEDWATCSWACSCRRHSTQLQSVHIAGHPCEENGRHMASLRQLPASQCHDDRRQVPRANRLRITGRTAWGCMGFQIRSPCRLSSDTPSGRRRNQDSIWNSFCAFRVQCDVIWFGRRASNISRGHERDAITLASQVRSGLLRRHTCL